MRNILFSVVLLGIYSSADAAVLCAPKKGTGPVTVREACGKNEIQLDPLTLGLQGSPGPQGPKGDKGNTGSQGPIGPAGASSSSAAVYDANGNKVGDVIGAGSPPASVIVTFEAKGNLVALSVNRSAISGNASSPLFFQSTDCSGTPVLGIGQDHLSWIFPPVGIFGPTKTIYMANLNAPTGAFQYHSLLNNDGSCTAWTDGTEGFQAIPLLDLDTLFTQPFHVEVQE